MSLSSSQARDLLQAARAARVNAYAPYSNFPVGAALLDERGRIFTGVNVENASYGLATCAERSAVARAVGEGAKTVQAVAVVGPGDNVPCAPCGSCRQILHEFGPGMTVVMPGADGEPQLLSLSRLLPEAFGPDDLISRQGGDRG